MKPVVLYAEDDENDALLCQRAFEHSGLQIDLRIVPDGACAIGWLLGQGNYCDRQAFPLPSLIITDSKMPLKGGLDVLKWIRARAEFKHIPVVLYYGSIFVHDLKVFDDLDVSACVEKSSNHRELVRVIGELLHDPAATFARGVDLEISAFQRTSAFS